MCRKVAEKSWLKGKPNRPMATRYEKKAAISWPLFIGPDKVAVVQTAQVSLLSRLQNLSGKRRIGAVAFFQQQPGDAFQLLAQLLQLVLISFVQQLPML
jgi:hypothetical protein